MQLPLFRSLQRQTTACVACVALVCAVAGRVAHAQEISPQQSRVQTIADDLRGRLQITDPVEVSIVSANRLLISVEPVEQSSPRRFLMRVEEDFVAGLDDQELSAAVAHELGHVWVFTHFPYLQTEQLANEVAQRLVTRDALALLYDKVWKRGGTAGDLARFLGPEAGLAP